MLVAAFGGRTEGYAVDWRVENACRVAAILPLYHCNLNPIELLRRQLQACVARRDVTFKLREVRQLVETELVTGERCQDANHHVIQDDQRKWELQAQLMKQWTYLSQTPQITKRSVTCLTQTPTRKEENALSNSD
jgi:hypothetical protein